MGDIILLLEDIRKQFHHVEVLRGVSFRIPKGSIFALLGANGAGKSTLLNIIMQILFPSSGKVFMNEGEVLKEKVGVVFQENTFDDELTIYENLIIRGRLYHIKKSILKKQIQEFSDDLGMGDFLYKKYKFCSGGQKRIAMIVRALIMNPDIVIMDEATTALDIETRKKVWAFLLKLNRERKVTIFFSSHYIEEAEVATDLCILKSGKIIFSGTYRELVSKYSRKHLKVNLGNQVINKEISSVYNALLYLKTLDNQKVDTFSLQNSNLEDIFLRLIHESVNL